MQDRVIVDMECDYETVPKLFKWYHFNDLERALTQIDFRVTPLLDVEYLRNGIDDTGILIETYSRPTQGCHFE